MENEPFTHQKNGLPLIVVILLFFPEGAYPGFASKVDTMPIPKGLHLHEQCLKTRTRLYNPEGPSVWRFDSQVSGM